MSTDNDQTKKKRSDLDKSIDLGMDQFGRFLKQRWIWILLIAFAIWFFTQPRPIAGIDPATLLAGIVQIGFAICYIVIQFAALFWFLGRPRLYWVMPGETGVTFDDYKGNPEVLESARRIVTLLRGVKEFEEMGGKPVRGLLLTGDPGTGKSYLAQCMSTEAGVPFAYASAASFRAMFIGMDVLMISRLYRKARRLAREYGGCVVFMDEIDAIGMSRSARGGGTMAMGGGIFGGMGGTGGLNQLLMEMDPPNIETGWFKKVLRSLGLYHGRAQNEPVLTVGATNVPDSLDPALLRPGRFDRKIDVAAPTDKYRPEVIEFYLNKVKHDPNISIAALSARLVRYTPVAIKHIVNEAVVVAHFDGREMITYRDLIEAQDVHDFGLRQLSELSAVDRRRIAYHEAAHTVAMYYLYERAYPAYVTIHQRRGDDLKGAAAFAAPRLKEEIATQTKEDVLTIIQVCLAARASEELFLDVQMTGVSGDLDQATTLAVGYIGLWGMDGTLISMRSGAVKPPRFEERVEELMKSQFKAVKQLLMEHSEAVIALAEALIERDELVTDEIKEIIDAADARSVARTVLSEFKPLLEVGTNGHNGHNGHNGRNGHNGHSNGAQRLIESSAEPKAQNSDQTSFQPPSIQEGPTGD